MSNLLDTASRFYKKFVNSTDDIPTASQDLDTMKLDQRKFRELPPDFEGFDDLNMPIKYLGHSTLQPIVIRTQQEQSTNNNNNGHYERQEKFSANKSNNIKSFKSNVPSTVVLAAVSSDEEDESEGSTYNNSANSKEENLFSKFKHDDSSRNIRSMEKARAALPPDFHNRISAPQPNMSKLGHSRENICDKISSGEESESDSNSSENIKEYSDDLSINREADKTILELGQKDNTLVRSGSSEEDNSFACYTPNSRSGISWALKDMSLSDWIESLKSKKTVENTIFIRTKCKRQDCKCAFRRHDTLVMYALTDAYLSHATWEKCVNKQSFQQQRPISNIYASQPKDLRLTEHQANIMFFRQCRGWYEVLNENNEPIPHWTTVEQLKIAKPATFLTRINLKCLLAPDYLSQSVEIKNSNDKTNAAGYSSTFIHIAKSPDALASSVVCWARAGTLFKFIEYLPNCIIRKGRRTRQMNLILAVERCPPAPSSVANNKNLERFIYIGVEDPCKDALFPTRLSISQVAGLENISGVHSMAGILLKFRLPVSVRPVAVQDPTNNQQDSIIPLHSIGSELNIIQAPIVGTEIEPAKFPLMPELQYTDKHLMRLKSIFRGDILLLAAVDNPARFFIITPAMLKDHWFYFGKTVDPMYLGLLTAHRNRTMNFIATAHKKESLDYLLQFMTETTRVPRDLSRDPKAGLLLPVDFYSSKMAVEIISKTGRDPRVGPSCDLKGTEVDDLYEEIEDIYFFIRNGYYPTRRTTIPSKSQSSNSPPGVSLNRLNPSEDNVTFTRHSGPLQKARPYTTYGGYSAPSVEPPSTLNLRNNSCFADRGPLLTSDQLLAASLNIGIESNKR